MQVCLTNSPQMWSCWHMAFCFLVQWPVSHQWLPSALWGQRGFSPGCRPQVMPSTSPCISYSVTHAEGSRAPYGKSFLRWLAEGKAGIACNRLPDLSYEMVLCHFRWTNKSHDQNHGLWGKDLFFIDKEDRKEQGMEEGLE